MDKKVPALKDFSPEVQNVVLRVLAEVEQQLRAAAQQKPTA